MNVRKKLSPLLKLIHPDKLLCAHKQMRNQNVESLQQLNSFIDEMEKTYREPGNMRQESTILHFYVPDTEETFTQKKCPIHVPQHVRLAQDSQTVKHFADNFVQDMLRAFGLPFEEKLDVVCSSYAPMFAHDAVEKDTECAATESKTSCLEKVRDILSENSSHSSAKRNLRKNSMISCPRNMMLLSNPLQGTKKGQVREQQSALNSKLLVRQHVVLCSLLQNRIVFEASMPHETRKKNFTRLANLLLRNFFGMQMHSLTWNRIVVNIGVDTELDAWFNHEGCVITIPQITDENEKAILSHMLEHRDSLELQLQDRSVSSSS